MSDCDKGGAYYGMVFNGDDTNNQFSDFYFNNLKNNQNINSISENC